MCIPRKVPTALHRGSAITRGRTQTVPNREVSAGLASHIKYIIHTRPRSSPVSQHCSPCVSHSFVHTMFPIVLLHTPAPQYTLQAETGLEAEIAQPMGHQAWRGEREIDHRDLPSPPPWGHQIPTWLTDQPLPVMEVTCPATSRVINLVSGPGPQALSSPSSHPTQVVLPAVL